MSTQCTARVIVSVLSLSLIVFTGVLEGCCGSALRPQVARDFFFDAAGKERTQPITAALLDMESGDEMRCRKAVSYLTDVFEQSEGHAGAMAGKALFEFVVETHPEYLTPRLEDLVVTRICRLAKRPPEQGPIFEHLVTGVDLSKPRGTPPTPPPPDLFSTELRRRIAANCELRHDGVLYIDENSWPLGWYGQNAVVEFDGKVVGQTEGNHGVVEIDLVKLLKSCRVPSNHVITSKMTVITPSKRRIRMSQEYRFSYVSIVDSIRD